MIVLSVLAVGVAGAYAASAFVRYQERTTGPSEVGTTTLDEGLRIMFRNTAAGQGYGHLASVSLNDPGGLRELTQVPCDRVYTNQKVVSCLLVVRGIPPRYRASLMDNELKPLTEWPLAGIPNRTRVSNEGLVATTAFVTGHSYASDSFSTETSIKSLDGKDYGNLEDFSIMIEGQKLTAADKNVWGVSFVDYNTFYATVASGGQTWLVLGNLNERRMTAVLQNAECTSVSPDGSKVAYKKRRISRPGETLVHWDAAVLDIASNKETVIGIESGFDDQLEWLDDQTLLFGLARKDTVGDSDIYSIRAKAGATPELFIEHAWSPSVERSR